MIHPHTELRFISEKNGYGVVPTRFINLYVEKIDGEAQHAGARHRK